MAAVNHFLQNTGIETAEKCKPHGIVSSLFDSHDAFSFSRILSSNSVNEDFAKTRVN
jgi:hypothetical protein